MNINADLSQIPIASIAIIVAGVIALVVIILKGLKSLNISKIGNVEIDYSAQATNAQVLQHIDDIDAKLRDDICDMTRVLSKQSTLNIGEDICTYGKRAIQLSITSLLQDRAACNHFTLRLSPTQIGAYRKRIMTSIEDYYKALLQVRGECQKGDLPPWETVESYYKELTDEWIKRVASIVSPACESKMHIYESAMKSVRKSDHWYKVFQECYKKNEQYYENMMSIIKGQI